ncbi:MAG: hypothetical protein M3N47_01715 [Chloroflexota bacterium]|nr:hypothetical protein [Chloroflexota bacterium]
MVDQPRAHDFLYVESDIPPDLTIKQWRTQRAAEHPHQHRANAGSRAARAKDVLWVLRHAAIRQCTERVRVWLNARCVGAWWVVLGPVRQPSAAHSRAVKPCPDGSLRES